MHHHPLRLTVRTAAGAAAALAVAAVVVVAPPAAAAPAAVVTTAGWGWGDDSHGQLGARPSSRASAPVAVPLPADTTALAEGGDTTYALAGTTVWAWGRGDSGQLGTGTTTGSVTPVRVPLPAVTAIAAGADHALAVTTAGAVYVWGRSDSGELAAAPGTVRSSPVRVPLPAGVRAVGVATGPDHSLVVTATGGLYAFGRGVEGQLGDSRVGSGSTVPVPVTLPAGVRVTAAAAGNRHSLALTSDGRVLVWGGNAHGQLGAPLGASAPIPTVLAVPDPARAVEVDAGSASSAVVTADGAVWTWGANDHGQLGDGTRLDRTAPVRAALPAGMLVATVAVADDSTVALTSDRHTLLSWGRGDDGRLGSGGTADRLAPEPVTVPTTGTGTRTWAAVATGGAATVAAPAVGALAGLAVSPAVTTVSRGTAVTFTGRGRDAVGDDLGSVAVAARSAGVRCAGAVCTFDRAGRHSVVVTAVSAPGISASAVVLVAGVPAATGSPTAPPTGPSTGPPTGTSASPGGAATATGTGVARADRGGSLPFTGVAVTGLVLLALACVGVGVSFTAAARRRRTRPEDPS